MLDYCPFSPKIQAFSVDNNYNESVEKPSFNCNFHLSEAENSSFDGILFAKYANSVLIFLARKLKILF